MADDSQGMAAEAAAARLEPRLRGMHLMYTEV
jgi:hypothetical protein